ncbi:hypothetical protein ISCGN_013554 [Ixodes scapularis]
MAKSPAKPAPKAFGTLGTGRILEPVYDRSAAAYIRDFSTLAVRRSLIPQAFSSMRRFFRRLVAGVTKYGAVGRKPITSVEVDAIAVDEDKGTTRASEGKRTGPLSVNALPPAWLCLEPCSFCRGPTQ